MSKLDPARVSLLTQFLHQWQFFLEGARDFSASHDFPSSTGQIPFLPIEIDASTFQKMWADFLPIFMNTNANSVEIVVTAENNIKAIYLHRANKQGMLIDLLTLNQDEIPSLSLNRSDVENTYKTLRIYCKKSHKVDIGNLRFISELLLIDLQSEFRKYTETKDYQKTRISVMVASFTDIILHYKTKGGLICYPPSPIITFLEGFKSIFLDISLNQLATSSNSALPKLKYTITLQAPKYLVSYYIQPDLGPKSISYLSLPESLQHEQNRVAQTHLVLKHCKRACKTKHNILIYVPALRKILDDFMQSPPPVINPSRRVYLAQQCLYFYREIGSCWDCYPRPVIFLEQLRYWIYTSGIRFNLRKISYWALPDLLQYVQNQNFGMKGKVLVLSSPSIDNLTFKSPSIRELKGYILGFVQGSLENIKPIESDILLTIMASIRSDLILQTPSSSKKRINPQEVLSEIRMRVSDRGEYIAKVLWVANTTPDAIGHSLWKFHSKFPLPFFYLRKIMSLLKNPKKFLIEPENPNLKQFRKTWTFTILKRMAPLITDLNEF